MEVDLGEEIHSEIIPTPLQLKGYRTDQLIVETELVRLKSGQEMYLLTIPGLDEGVCVDKWEIDNGHNTLQTGYDMLCQMWLDQKCS
jgi:hypothetical protein